MKHPEINRPSIVTWNGRECVVINNNMADVVLCMRVGTTSGIFSVRRSDLPELAAPNPTMLQQMQEKYKLKNQL